MIRWVNRAPCSLKCSRKWRLNRASIHPRYTVEVPWVYKLADFLAHLERMNKKKPTHFCCRFIGSKPPTSDSLYEGVL
jgi:hypothetical protein